jgi:chorismate mutase/prephenate dehydratase
MQEIINLRNEIDGVDEQIQKLLSKRADMAIAMGKLKNKATAEYYLPEREAEILNKVIKRNQGSLKNSELLQIFRAIIAANRGLQKQLQVAFLGPLGTFSHEAVVANFGENIDLKPQQNIKEIFRAVTEDECEYGIVPIENSTEGVVNQTLDCFIDTQLLICNELSLPIHHYLLSREQDLSAINQVYSHAQALAQCAKWLEKNLPQAAAIPLASSSQACLLAAREANTAAIGSEIALRYHNLNIIAKNIEDEVNNTTRFYVLGKQATKPSQKDKTAILIWISHATGELAAVLACFAAQAINLTLIESRPCKGTVWEYYFFLETEGHQTDAAFKKTLEQFMARKINIKILGSFPRAVL